MDSLNIDDHYSGGGNYLKAADLNGRRMTVTISVVKLETMKEGDKKLVLSFEESEKTFTLNKTNAQMIANLLQERDAGKWIGTTISLRPDKTQDPTGKIVDCIRVDFELPPQKYPQSLGGRVAASYTPQTQAQPQGFAPPQNNYVPIQPEPDKIPF